MKIGPRILIYAAAALALVVGAVAYGSLEEEHHETGLLAGDLVKVAAVGAVLAVVAVISFVYLARNPPEEK